MLNVQYETCYANSVDFYHYTKVGVEEFHEYINRTTFRQRQCQKTALFLYNYCDISLHEVFSDDSLLQLYIVVDYD